jgi:hypothetical protein
VRGSRAVAVLVGIATMVGAPLLGSSGALGQDGDDAGGGGFNPNPAATTTTTRPGTPTAPTTAGTTVTTATTTTTAAPTQGVAQVSDPTVTRGQQVTVTGDGFAPNQALRVTFATGAISLGTTTSDASGRFTAPVRIPTTAPAGSHRILVAGSGATGTQREVAATVTVNLTATGRMTVPLALTGLVVLLLGARAVRYGQWTRPVSTLGWVPPPRWSRGRGRKPPA